MPERLEERGPEQGEEQGRERRGWLRAFGLAEVYNPSMVPTLRPGDQLVVQYGAVVRPGDVVVLRHPFRQDLLIVKRAVERRGDGWWVQGDNPFVENDSREFGVVPDELVVARAWVRVRPPRGFQRSLSGALSWAVSAVRPVRAERSPSRRLRAR
ncbi:MULTISPECIES: nickel-type superoxide dismutase maturation protease [Streptomyces]|uniref:Nickel-type superoxide dismutase maturation protease n=2 Tax=Streptomyces rimosus subsp. rimosus TaxID=132474 RepID=L8EKE5_STRR1|nr:MULTISPECIES: nickel-type superoxide dismutase maturation protease [Streptomyces]KOG70614.1 signal peptidase [Kitasatospora aureofaciens]MYT40919.1 nickel-type superoxide dismutase maturation protease [Streptomyces sp. SID5471]KEF05505.1 signal peptidase [Streptomyces rimosus]KOT31946.1 signal peptidase [Streptomyces sp. NRRL WC-3701]KOT32471.1 signal peptidase [Streptomyces rimosus subsp. rimosus]